eukprot:804768-Alexandrium_andersonii.AAC.1
MSASLVGSEMCIRDRCWSVSVSLEGSKAAWTLSNKTLAAYGCVGHLALADHSLDAGGGGCADSDQQKD